MAESDLKYRISSSYDSKGADAAAAQLRSLKDQLDALQNKKLQLTADSTQVTADINRVKQQIADLDGQIRLGLDDADATARLAELKAKLQELQDKKLSIRADASDVDAEISKVKLALASLPDEKKIKISEDSSSAREDLRRLREETDKAQKGMQDSWKRTQAAGTAATFSIVTALASLATAMVPVAAGAISMGGALVSGFGSATLAAGAFGISLKSTIGSAQGMATNAYALQMKIQQNQAALGSLTKGSAAYNGMVNQIKVNQAALTQVMGQGTPVQNQLAQSILNLHVRWNSLQTVMEKATGPLIQTGIRIIGNMMQAMVPLVVSVANALKPAVDQMLKFTTAGSGISSSGFARMIQWIEAVGVPNLQSAIQIAHNLIITVSQIFMAWGNSGTNMMNDMVRITAEIVKWGAGGGFARFQQQVQQNMPMIKQFFTALWEAIVKLTQAAYQFGPVGLSMLGMILRIAAALPIGAVQGLFVAFMAYKAVASIVTIFSAVSTAVHGIGLAFKTAQMALLAFKYAQAGATVVAEENAAAQLAVKIGTLASAVASGIATAAQWVWNAAVAAFDLLAAPIILLVGAIVLAVAALGFGIYELVKHWSTVWNWMKKIFDEAVEFFRGRFGIFVAAVPVIGWAIYIAANWQRLWGDVKRYFDEAWSFIKHTFDEAVQFLRGKYGILVTGIPIIGWLLYIAANWQRLWGDIKKYFTDAINGIKSAWDTVSSALSSAWNTVWNALKSAAQAVWNALRDAWNTVLNALKSAWDTVGSALSNAWNTVWNALKSAAQAVWDALKNAWNTVLNGIKSAWDTVSSALSSAWNTVWNTIKSTANTVWSWITSTWSSTTGTIKSVWDTVSSSLGSAWNSFWNGLKTAVSTAKNDISSIWDGVKAVFATPVNFIIGVWDTVADVIGAGHINPIPNEPGFFKLAEGGQVRGPGGPTDDKVPGWLSNKEFVLNADATAHWGLDNLYAMNRKQMPDMFAMASGGSIQRMPGFMLAGGDTGAGQTGATSTQGAQGAGTNASKTVVRTNLPGSQVFDTITHGLAHPVSTLKNIAADVVYDIAKPILDSIVAAIPNPAPPFKSTSGGGGMPKSGGKKIEDFILSKLKGAQDAAKTAAASVGGAIPTGQHLALIDQALTADGIAKAAWPEWEAGLNTLITRESGWQPGVVNTTDSNAKAGTPSTGLMQTIKPTFEAYRNKSLPDSMTDPVANIAAGINYINAVYGGIAHVQQANASLPAKGYDMGGPLRPGLTLAHNTTGAMEGVLNPTGLAAIGGLSNLAMLNAGTRPTGSASGGFGANVSLSMPISITCQSDDPEAIIEQVEEELLPKLTVLIKAGLGAR